MDGRGGTDVVPRLSVPLDLTDEEAAVWTSVVDSEPAGLFAPSIVPLLKQYCRHAVAARRVAELIEKAIADPHLAIVDYDRLLRMQQSESAIISSLATKLRLAQQSTPYRAKVPVRKPWDGALDDDLRGLELDIQ